MKEIIEQYKWLIRGVVLIIGLVLFSIVNPFSINDAGERTVVQQVGGKQFVQFTPGAFYAGFFAKETTWPNQISVSYQTLEADYDMKDNLIEISRIGIRFNDATTADMSGIVQYILPSTEEEMITLHNAHRTPQSLVSRRLAPYTKECLQSSCQLMTSEMHYGGGRAQMSQDYVDQLKSGVFLLSTNEINSYDSLEKENKKVYKTSVQLDANKVIKRKPSSIKEYGITVADAQITDVDYQAQVDSMLTKKIAAATKASISRQDLMTAQQQALTSKAQGEKILVDIEYEQKQNQTKLVVAAETKVKVAEQDKLQQRIQAEAADLEARKIKTLADANAYEKQRLIQADGALDTKLAAYVEVQKAWAAAAANSNWVPTYVSGGGFGNAGGNVSQMVEIMSAKAAKDLMIDLKNK